MLLVTTADENTWGQDEEILFLGEWCLVSGREEALRGRHYRVLPYHWDDREKLRHDAQMLQARYEQILPRLSERLNVIQNTERDITYWRLVAGPWLLWILSVVWERRENLRLAVEAGATETHVYQGATLPTSRFEILGPLSAQDDSWNHMLCARLLDQFPQVRQLPLKATPAAPAARTGVRPRWTVLAKKMTRMLARLIPQRVAFVSMHVKPSVQVRLQLSQRQLPLMLSPPPMPSFSRQERLRESLQLDCGEDGFGAALAQIISETFPDVLLEGYTDVRALALKSFPSKPRTIVTANAQYNELFCLWAGEHRGRAPLVLLQHGGHYGVDRTEMMEDHELAVADRYCSWGWRRNGYDNIVPLPAFKLQGVKATPAAPDRHGLVAIYDAAHRYPNRLYNVPIGGQRRADNAGQLQLLNALPSAIRTQLRLRCHPQTDGYGLGVDLEKAGLSHCFDGASDMLAAIASARLCLIGSNSTPLLEALCSGTPTVAFYDPRFAEEREEAKPLFDALRAAGILHTDPVDCAAMITDIWDDPVHWMNSPDVRNATGMFVEHFARTSPTWLSDWRNFLRFLN
jgi:putative transferase (TIGR04331 family)